MNLPSTQSSIPKPLAKARPKPEAPAPEKKTLRPLIILPAYNEAQHIARVLEDIRREAPGFPILVINDGSRDQTERVSQENGARVISLPYNSGYGVALQTGFRYALRHRYNLVIQMDADGQHDARSIKFLLKEILKNDVDVVIGSRFLGPCGYKPGFFRRTGMRIFATLASVIMRQKITDPTSGFQALKNGAIRFVASDLYPPDYPDADFLILMKRSGYCIREIPVHMHPGPGKKSMHGGPQSLYYIFKMFLSIFVTVLRQKPERI